MTKPGRPTKAVARQRRIFARDGWLCQCRGCQASGNPLPAQDVHHLVPLADGGKDADENLVSMSTACHQFALTQELQDRARTGSGVEPAVRMGVPAAAATPLEFLTSVMNDLKLDPGMRLRAAIAAAQYVHTRRADGGIKDERQSRAEKAVDKFRPSVPPRLVSNG